MAESFFYKGHHIEFKLIEWTYQKWFWSYTVDGTGPYQNESTPFASRDLAKEDVTAIAKSRFDRE